MLVTSLVMTCLFALMGILQTLPGDGISATLARILVPTVSGPSRTLRISSPTSLLSLSPEPVSLPLGIDRIAQQQLADNAYWGHEEAPSHSPKVLLTLASKTIPGVPASTGQRSFLWAASLVVAVSILVSSMILPANVLNPESHEDDRTQQHALGPPHPQVRHLPRGVGNTKNVRRTPNKVLENSSLASQSRSTAARRSAHTPYRATPENVLACTYTDSSACHNTPANLRVTPISHNAEPGDGDHTNRRVFGIPISAQATGRTPSSLDDLDDGTYLRDALGLIDWSDMPPQCGYWPTLDDDDDDPVPGEDGARPRTPWYLSSEDLRGWVFPAGRVRPDRSDRVEPSVAGEG